MARWMPGTRSSLGRHREQRSVLSTLCNRNQDCGVLKLSSLIRSRRYPLGGYSCSFVTRPRGVCTRLVVLLQLLHEARWSHRSDASQREVASFPFCRLRNLVIVQATRHAPFSAWLQSYRAVSCSLNCSGQAIGHDTRVHSAWCRRAGRSCMRWGHIRPRTADSTSRAVKTDPSSALR